MRRYETFVIIDPDISEEQRAPVIERSTDLITRENGLTIKVDDWGTRKLAYEIKKKPRGYYVRLDYCGTAAIVDEMERFFRIDDRVMKYMTVLLDKDIDVEKIKEDLAREKAEQEASAAAAESKIADDEATPAGENDAEGSSEAAVASETEAKPEAETEDEPEVEAEAETEAETADAPAPETEAKKEES